VAIAEVQAEQLGIVRSGQRDASRRLPAAPAEGAITGVPLLRPPPMADSGSRDSEPPRHLAVVHADRDQIESSPANLHAMHIERMFPRAPDGLGPGGCYPDARLAAIV
jgi:hypothetical protein